MCLLNCITIPFSLSDCGADLIFTMIDFAVLRIRNEEKVLGKHFGPAWGRYKATRWRLVPLVW